MVVSSRVFVAVGLGLAGLAFLVGPTLGQQPQQDGAVRKSSTGSQPTGSQSSTPSKPAPPTPATFGTVDMTAVFKGYDKVKASAEEFRASVETKKKDLMKFMSEAQQEQEMLAKLAPGTVDYKKHEDRITQLKAQHEALREQSEREFTLREAEMLATLYKEIQAMVSRVAQYRGMTYVMRVSNDPITGSNPNSAMMAIERTVVYADSRNDVTNDVIYNLNLAYKAAGGTTPKTSTPSATAPGTTPATPSGN